MTKPKVRIKMRSMTLEDFDVIFAIDKDLMGFFEHMGFKAGHLIDYTKSL